MKSKRCWISVVMLAVLFAAGMWAAGASEELTDKQWSLAGIDALYIFVQGLTEGTQKTGLTTEQIQTEVENKLKQLGVRIVSEEEGLKIAGSPVLYVNISVHKMTRTPAFVYHVDVGVLQKVTLVREPTIRAMSITWNKGQLGYCPSSTLAKSLRGTVKYLMDRFQEDYRAANPKPKASESSRWLTPKS
jgi:hypothetical protein